MAFQKTFRLLLLLFSFLITVVADKINERRILLPYNNGVPTNFTLETYGETISISSCYRWSSSRPDIASVRHLPDKNDKFSSPSCSKRAIVTVVSTIPKHQSTIITAHEIKTNVQIRCDVEIDIINHVAIQTTTKEIVLGELPESIKVFGYTDKNDMFTSIGGVSFDWTLSPSDVLRYRTWSTSPYAAPDFVEYWESRGSKSSYILVEGVKTGSATIRANLIGDGYRNQVPPAEINIYVVANLLLIPSNDVFLVPGAKVKFRAEISKQGPRVPLDFSNEQYYLEVDDPEIAFFDEETSELEALREGNATVMLKDRNMAAATINNSSLFTRTRTDVYVLQPNYILISISPGDSFQLCNDFIYQLQLSIHDDSHHRLYPSDNLDLELKFNEEYFEILEQTKNKTHYTVRTKKIGTTKLIAEFYGAGYYRLDTPLNTLQDVTIYPPIKLEPEVIYLPSIPKPINDNDFNDPTTYLVYVKATGATGTGYDWQTANESLIELKYSPEESSTLKALVRSNSGQILITCTDVHNSLIFNAQMKIKILKIDAVEVLPSIVEAEIGGRILIPIAVLAQIKSPEEDKYYFDDCSKVKFDVSIVEKSRVRFVDEFSPGIGSKSCRSLSFECLSSGNSRVTISYRDSDQKVISTHTIIGCYKPLRLVHPDSESGVLLALGSTIDLVFEGGPRPWSMFPEGHYARTQLSNGSLIQTREIRDRYRYNKDLHVFRAICQKYGETRVELIVGNHVSPTLPKPASTQAMVRLKCSQPETLIIKPKIASTCPQQDGQYTMEKNRPVEIDVKVLDQHGMVFYNATSLMFEWSKDMAGGMFEQQNGVREEINGARGYPILIRSYQILNGLTAQKVRVRCRITGYQKSVIVSREKFDIHREIELLITDPLLTEENFITILKHTDYSETIRIKRGSGFFNIDWTARNSIEIKIDQNDKRIMVIRPREIGSGIISIRDLCLDYPPYTIQYSVIEPVDIRVEMVDKIQLGDKVEGTFFLINNRRQKLSSNFHSLMDFSISISNGFVSVGEIKKKNDYQSSFTIKAERLGHCKLIVQSQSTKIRQISSIPVDLQIFSPLIISPNNITLIVGNYFQPNFIGGPQTQRNIQFSIDDGTIATMVNPDGLLQAQKIGRSKLLAKVVSVDNDYEYSHATADLWVVPLKKIKIYAPINQMLVGRSVPLYLIGHSEQHETPFMFGNADPQLKITWSLSNDEIGTLENSFQSSSIATNYPMDQLDPISMRFVSKSIGLITVKVSVEVTLPAKESYLEQLYKNQKLSDTIQLQIYPDYLMSISSDSDSVRSSSHLLLQFPLPVVLMSPQSQLLLHQNQLDSIRYQISNTSSQIRLLNQTNGNVLVEAGDKLESTSLMVQRDLYRTGILQYFSQIIHVEKVRYLSLEFDHIQHPQKFLSRLNLISFPIGSEITIVVHHFDQLGRRFDAVKSNIRWTMSRQDIITVLTSTTESPQSLRIRSLKPGSMVLLIEDLFNHVRQFLKINVNVAIYESTMMKRHDDISTIQLEVGDVVCLRSSLEENIPLKQQQQDNNNENNRIWSLSKTPNYMIAWIHRQHGILVALNPGKDVIFYNHSSSISTYKHLKINPITKIRLDTSSLIGISTVHQHLIPIITTNNNNNDNNNKNHGGCIAAGAGSGGSNTGGGIVHDLNDIINSEFNENFLSSIPFTCDITFDGDQYGSITSMEMLWNVKVDYYHHSGGSWACILQPKNDLDLDSIALWDSRNVTLTVMVTLLSSDPLLSYNDIDSNLFQITIPFFPSFRTSIRQIILSTDSRDVRFTVHSTRTILEDLIILSSNDDIISVQKLFNNNNYQDQQDNYNNDDTNNNDDLNSRGSNSMKIIVTLKQIPEIFTTDLTNLNIIISSKLINQTEKIPIRIKLYPNGGGGIGTFSSKNLLFTTTGVAGIAGTTTEYLFYQISIIFMTFLLGFLIYFMMKKFIWDQYDPKSYYIDPITGMFKQSPLSNSNSKSPRIIDYQTTPVGTSSNRNDIGSSMRDSSLLSSGQSISGTKTPQTPRSTIGRPLYSTRSFFT